MYAFSVDKNSNQTRWVKFFTDAETETTAQRSLVNPELVRKNQTLVNYQNKFIFATGGLTTW